MRRIAAILSLDVVGYSAMMQQSAVGALRELNRIFRTIVRPAVQEFDGRIVKLLGDGALVEFSAARDAVQAAHRIQTALTGGDVRLRAGVHVGDVTVDGEDVFGDAVNIAARLQAEARPGDGLISRVAVDMAGGDLPSDIALKPEGSLRLKGVSRPVEALSLNLGGAEMAMTLAALEQAQEVRFATSKDGVRLAWTAIGEGPVLVKAPNWISHLELDWKTVNGGWLADLARRYTLIRFDQRGNGLSDRDVSEITLERMVDDLEAVFDAAGIERAPIYCKSQGTAIAAAFAVRRPERVSGLVGFGGFRQGPLARSEPRHVELTAALDAMGRVGWDDEYPSIRDHFARILAPDATPEDQRNFAEAMRDTITAHEFSRFREAIGRIDVTDLLPQVQCPALILHSTGERMHPLQQGRSLAAGIPNSRFVALDSNNHVMPVYDPAWPVALREVTRFLAELT